MGCGRKLEDAKKVIVGMLRIIHWVTWEKICRRKKYGGFGVTDTKLFNESLVVNGCGNYLNTKQYCRLEY